MAIFSLHFRNPLIAFDFSVEVIYTTAHTIHAKSERMRTLDEELGDVKMRIIDKETTITLRQVRLPFSVSGIPVSKQH